MKKIELFLLMPEYESCRIIPRILQLGRRTAVNAKKWKACLLGLCGGGGSHLETNWACCAQQHFPGPRQPFWENKGSLPQPE